MTDGKVLEFRGVTKIFGDVAAVSDFTARVEPGVVTGFVGPNGAGKSTTLRILLGDIRPTEGTALIGGVPYARLSQPRRVVGALLENQQYRPRRTAERHLLSTARAIGVPATRVTEVLDVVGLGGVGNMRIGGFSLGMRQRLGVAEALLGDPAVLVFDEPANGLDPEGIRWMRLLMRRLAEEGRTVLMSSHVLSEVQQVADNILIISNGRLLFSGGIETLADVDAVVAVDSPHRSALRDALRERGYEFELLRSGINVAAASTSEIGELAAEAGVPLSSLQLKQQSLEDVFLKIVNGTWAGPASAAADEAGAEAEAGAEGQAEAAQPVAGEVPPMPEAVVAEDADTETAAAAEKTTDEAGAQVETVDELPFAPATVDTEVAVDEQPIATVLDAPARSYGDPLAFLTRPLSEVEKDVVAGEAELIAASPEGEQPTPGWVPTPEDIPSPHPEDGDDPDALETPDSVIELPDGDDAEIPAETPDEAAAEEGDADGFVTDADAGEPAEGEPVAEPVEGETPDEAGQRAPWPGLAAWAPPSEQDHEPAADKTEPSDESEQQPEASAQPDESGESDESEDFAADGESAEADYSPEAEVEPEHHEGGHHEGEHHEGEHHGQHHG
ncbi:ATP-binding cassette domain-containing protein [Microbacterium paludicola]|uniref:ATP-binding cassette domain-containing protein n=1 Tax=Microbacterium paludicola TaxID=300019 RepID=UPI0031D19943